MKKIENKNQLYKAEKQKKVKATEKELTKQEKELVTLLSNILVNKVLKSNAINNDERAN